MEIFKRQQFKVILDRVNEPRGVIQVLDVLLARA